MKNAEMTENRFARWAAYRKLAARIHATLAADGVVQIGGYGRVLRCTQKHAGMFKATKTGVFIQRGKSWDCLNFSKIEHYHRQAA